MIFCSVAILFFCREFFLKLRVFVSVSEYFYFAGFFYCKSLLLSWVFSKIASFCFCLLVFLFCWVFIESLPLLWVFPFIVVLLFLRLFAFVVSFFILWSVFLIEFLHLLLKGFVFVMTFLLLGFQFCFVRSSYFVVTFFFSCGRLKALKYNSPTFHKN